MWSQGKSGRVELGEGLGPEEGQIDWETPGGSSEHISPGQSAPSPTPSRPPFVFLGLPWWHRQ